jgi:hypothetical protein
MIATRSYQFLRFYLCIAAVLGIVSQRLHADDSHPSMIDRIMNPDRNQKSSYQGQVFNPGGGSFDKSFDTGTYAGVKDFNSKSFVTKAFDGAKQSWLGKKLFHEKTLPENLQGANRDATKQFSSSAYGVKDYGGLDKKSPYSSKDAYATSEISLKGKSQGAIDNDPRLQEAIKKGLSIDDVRKLLNKLP